LNISKSVEKICSVLEKVSNWIDDIPPIKQPMRYGNKAFRLWIEKLVENSSNLMLEILPEELKGAEIELSDYWVGCFGDKTRIDYGTGHETTFIAWLCCLHRLGVLSDEDYTTTVLKVFNTYLDLMRKLQKTYLLEPAGSHGVWSLDDYQFLPFYFGSSQLIGHKNIIPKSTRKPEVIEGYCKEYMYLGCIKFITEVKSGLFSEHSPILNSIADIPNWEKVNAGMLKMYNVEVLSKFPVMQHFLFGSILSLTNKSDLSSNTTTTTKSDIKEKDSN